MHQSSQTQRQLNRLCMMKRQISIQSFFGNSPKRKKNDDGHGQADQDDRPADIDNVPVGNHPHAEGKEYVD